MSIRVLVIEDDPELGKDLVEFLTDKQFEVRLCKDGHSGLNTIEEFHPDIVLLDIVLRPVSDGNELLFGDQVLREIIKRKIQTKVIIISQYFKDIDSIVKFIQLGAAAYIEKPFGMVNLYEKIKKVILEDSAVSTNIASLPPILSEYIQVSHGMIKEYQSSENIVSGYIYKMVYIGFVTAILFVLAKFSIISNPFILFMILLILIIPVDNIKKMVASILGNKTEIEFNSSARDYKDSGH